MRDADKYTWIAPQKPMRGDRWIALLLIGCAVFWGGCWWLVLR